MLIQDSSLDFIEASEQDVVSVHRSSSAVVVESPDFPPQSCEAYVCIIKEGNNYLVHVALILSKTRKTLFYSPETTPVQSGDLQAISQEALNFTEKMGFAMEVILTPIIHDMIEQKRKAGK